MLGPSRNLLYPSSNLNGTLCQHGRGTKLVVVSAMHFVVSRRAYSCLLDKKAAKPPSLKFNDLP